MHFKQGWQLWLLLCGVLMFMSYKNHVISFEKLLTRSSDLMDDLSCRCSRQRKSEGMEFWELPPITPAAKICNSQEDDAEASGKTLFLPKSICLTTTAGALYSAFHIPRVLLVGLDKITSNKVQEQFFSDDSYDKWTLLVQDHEERRV